MFSLHYVFASWHVQLLVCMLVKCTVYIVWHNSYVMTYMRLEMMQRRAARWVSNSYSSYDKVSAMLSNLDWRSLKYRWNDSRLAMFYKIHYGLVAVPMSSYFERPIRITRHMHPLSIRQVHVSADSYRYSFFPMTVVYRIASLQT